MADKADFIAPIERGVRRQPRSRATSFGKTISLSETLKVLKVGEAFRIDECRWRSRVTATAHYYNIKVRTEKLDDGRLLVERV